MNGLFIVKAPSLFPVSLTEWVSEEKEVLLTAWCVGFVDPAWYALGPGHSSLARLKTNVSHSLQMITCFMNNILAISQARIIRPQLSAEGLVLPRYPWIFRGLSKAC